MAEETLKKFTVYLEEEQIQALKEIARELRRTHGKGWSAGAVVRLALSQFLTQRGKIL